MKHEPTDAGAAWAAFFVEHRRALSVYALSLTGSPADAHDLLHDVLVRMVHQRREARDAKPYVMRCLRNLAIDRRRSRGRQPGSIAECDEPAILDTTAETLDRREQIAAADAVLRLLGEVAREIVVLKIYGEMTFREIAELLERPMGTVTSAYARAIEELRTALGTEERYAC